MGKNNTSRGSSLRNVITVKKEQDFQLIDFRLLPFVPLRQNNLISFREKNAQGLFIVKERHTNRISHMESSGKCIYRMLRNAASRFKLNGIHDLCVIKCDKKMIEKAKNAVLESHKRVALFNRDFEFFKKSLLSGRPINLSKISFVPIYKPKEQMSTRTKKSDFRSNIIDFRKRSGVYIFKENGIVVYVGKSVNNLYRTVYGHMLRQYDDYKRNRRAIYNDKRHINHYEVGLIEVVKGSRSNRSLAIAVGKLERFLIHQFKPRDNFQYVHRQVISGKLEEFDEGDFWRPPVTNIKIDDSFLEDPPF